MTPLCYTVGYGGRTKTGLQELLTSAGVKLVVDVRARPERAFAGAFALSADAERGIRRTLSEVGIGYVSITELGNSFDGPDWIRQYRESLAGAGPALAQLEGLDQPLCLLCAEKNVTEPDDTPRCHRLLIAEQLLARGWRVSHL